MHTLGRERLGPRIIIALVACAVLACSLEVTGTSDGAPYSGAHRDAGDGPSSHIDASGSPQPGDDVDSGSLASDAGNAFDARSDAIVFGPDASASEPCDLDGDGFRARGSTCGGSDCCDYDGRTWPGEQDYFEAPNACGSFDYDCDGAEQGRDSVVACVLKLFKCTGDGFASTSAPCGESADYVVCDWDFLRGCIESYETRVQACR